jgi:PAS domain S-box-containing protein
MNAKPRILIADDIAESLRATRQLLEAHGYETLGAENGREALGLLSAEHPDLALINSSLPDMDGFEICASLEALPEAGDVFAVIVLGEKLGAENRARGAAQGVNGYIVRPIDDETLLLRMQALLNQRDAEAAVHERKRLDESLQEKNKVLAALHETTLELISEHDLQTLLENIVKRAGQLVGTESGFLDLVEPGTQRLKPQVGLGALVDSLKYESQPGQGLAGVVWQSGQPMVVDDYESWSRRMPDFAPGKLSSVAGVPLISGGRVVGVLGLAYSPPSTRSFGLDALELLTQFARLAAIAIENARLFSALQQELADHHRAEQALRTSEERFRLAFRISPDSININRMEDGLYVDINEGFTRLTGYTREEVLGKTSLELNIWHDPQDRARLVAGLRRDGVVNNLEAQFQMKDGRLITALMSARIIMLDEVPHLLSITRDIDEKKHIEEALRDSEVKFRRVVEASPTAMHFYQLENHDRLVLLDANPAADRMLGISHQALKGGTLEEAFPNLVTTGIPEIYKKVASGELGPQAFETQYYDESLGGYFDVHVYQTSPGFILVNFIDISERKKTEQALREREFWLSESQRVGRIGSYSLDIPRNRWESSDVMDDIFGIQPDYEKTLLSWNGLVHPDEREAMLDYFNRHVISEKQPFDKEYRIVRPKNGEERWVWGRGELVFGEDGAPVRMIGTIQDVTARRQAEEQIRSLNAQLEQRVAERTTQLQMANKELEAFAYSVSHDLRAPLRGISGWSQALLEDYAEQLDDQGRKYLERVGNETRYMGQLIDDLLQLSRLTRSEMKFGPVDLSALALAITKRLKETLGERKVEFVIQPGLVAQGDTHLLEIALTNLLSNACKFTGTRELARVEFGQTLQNGKQAYFVRDNGVGFDMIYARNLFGAFQRMHKQSEFPGSGIGLATVQRIIHRHGGLIWADSKPDEGAVFYFSL